MKTIDYARNLPPYIDRYEFEERAAIKEFEGNIERKKAEKEAYIELQLAYIDRGRNDKLFN